MKTGNPNEENLPEGSKKYWWKHRRWVAAAAVAILGIFPEIPAHMSAPPASGFTGAEESQDISAQVSVIAAGRIVGGGTIIHRQWVLTAAHLFDSQVPLSSYRITFGVNDLTHTLPSENYRRVARVVFHPTHADIAMVQLDTPLPENTVIPRLAEEPPNRYQRIDLFGWAPDMQFLRHLTTVVYDPIATENSRALKEWDEEFESSFPQYAPMVIAGKSQHGDSGSGSFLAGMILAGVQVGNEKYYTVKKSGNLSKKSTKPAFQQPVWQYRDWINQVIEHFTPETPPDPSTPSSSEPPRRHLSEDDDGDLPMTVPPPIHNCGQSQTPCGTDPAWVLGNLPGSGNYRGTALAVCARAPGNTCSFGEATYPGDAIERLALGPTGAPGTAPRQVMIWCKTRNVFAPGSPARPALRISFTNGDNDEVPEGKGWWDVTPDQVATGTDQIPAEIDQFSTC